MGNGAEEQEQLAHDGGEGEFTGLAATAESLVEVFEVVVMSNGGEGGHVEGATHLGASTADGAIAPTGAAVLGPWGEAYEGGELSAVVEAQLWEVDGEDGAGLLAHAWDTLVEFGLAGQELALA